MTKAFTFFFVLLTLQAYNQSRVAAFFRLSGPEKCWTFTHLCKAGKAHRITTYVRNETARMYRAQELDTFNHGGKLDAFRHAFWMACLAEKIGASASRKLGQAHERGNYKAFKKGKTEDGFLQDATAVEMDLYNNEEGLRIAGERKSDSLSGLREQVLQAIKEGKMKIMKRNAQGRLTDCNGTVPIVDDRKKTDWKLPFCLISSNTH